MNCLLKILEMIQMKGQALFSGRMQNIFLDVPDFELG